MLDHNEQMDSNNHQSAPQNASNTPAAPAVIGKSIRIKGTVSGSEDLIINGVIEGSVELRDNDVVVGASGQIQANVLAKQVEIVGEVTGDITGIEKVVLSSEGRVHGNIVAPRVTLEDGAKFKGSIDMDPSDQSSALPPQLQAEHTPTLSAEVKTEPGKRTLEQVKRKAASAAQGPAKVAQKA